MEKALAIGVSSSARARYRSGVVRMAIAPAAEVGGEARRRSRWRGSPRSARAWSSACAGRRDGRRCGSSPRRSRPARAPAAARARRRSPAAARARPAPTPWTPTIRRALFIMVNMQARPRCSLADQPGDRAGLRAEAAVAIDHGAGRRAVDAELLLQARAEDVVALRRACRRHRPASSAPGRARCRAIRAARRGGARAPDARCFRKGRARRR